nr:nitrilase-related carbon-nitrogen hydrolase [Rhodococcus sp. (in: high G+C Gram-positive bacteria)]
MNAPKSPDSITVAAVQMEMRRESTVDDFKAHLADIVRQAVAQGAELVLLPELSTSGLLATHRDVDELTAADMSQAYRDIFPAVTEQVTAIFTSLAAEHGVWLAGGSHWRQAEDGTYRNTAFLAHPDGRLDFQDKLHLTWPEVDLGTTPGDRVALFDVRGIKVAIQTCADIEFAEVTRALVVAGADVVLCPSLTWNSRGATRVASSCLARSVEQQVFVVQSPMIGTSDIPRGAALFGKGYARITVPVDRSFGVNSGVIASADSTNEAVVVATLDIDKGRRSRVDSDSIGMRHARPDLYRDLLIEMAH